GEEPDLEIAEVDADEPASDLGRRLRAVADPVEPRRVEDPARVRRLADRRRADRGQPRLQLGAAARRVHHEIAADPERGAVARARPDAGDTRKRRAGDVLGFEARDLDAVAEVDEAAALDVPAQHP